MGTTASELEFNDQIARFFEATFAASVVVGFEPAQTGPIAAAFCPYTTDQSHVDPPPMLKPVTYTLVASTRYLLLA